MYKTILALALLLAAPAAYAQDAPIVGTWRGTYYQEGVATPYPVTITVNGTTGTTHYNGATECRGELTGLRYANGQLYGNMYRERITQNAHNPPRNNGGCYNGGLISLTLAPNGQLSFRWSLEWEQDFVRAGGELDPVR